MLLIKLLAVSVAILSLGCMSLPKPPEGSIYLHSVKTDRALCSDLKTGTTCPALPMSQTDKFYMLAPATWEGVQNYIDALIRLAEKSLHSDTTDFFLHNTYEEAKFDQTKINEMGDLVVPIDALYDARDYMVLWKHSLRSQLKK